MTIQLSDRRGSARLLATAGVMVLLGASMALVQQNQAGGIETLEIAPNFYMIAGGGEDRRAGGAGRSGPGECGAADMSDKAIAAVKKVTPQPIRYIVYTAADPDAVGGNGAVSKAGYSLAQNRNTGAGWYEPHTGDYYRHGKRAETDERAFGASRELIRRTTGRRRRSRRRRSRSDLNHEGIQILAQPAADTDGDVMVYFRRSDVLVTGDIMDTTRFPVIDVEKGGSIQGEIDALNRIVEIAISSIPLVWQDGGTTVIPGHGRICDQADVVEYRDMVTIIRDVVQDMITRGMTLEQIKKADPTSGYRKRYGADTGPGTTDMFVEAIYKSLTAKK